MGNAMNRMDAIIYHLGLSLLSVFLVSACSQPAKAPFEKSAFTSETPVRVSATVVDFEEAALHVDFIDNTGTTFDALVLRVDEPLSHAGQRITLLYQGEPELKGARLVMGSRLRFLAPASSGSAIDGPYLHDLLEAVLLP